MLDKHTHISLYWFSGTGNTYRIASHIFESLKSWGYEICLVPLETTDPQTVSLNHTIGFVVPVAMQGTSLLVWDFLKRMPKANGTEVFFVDTLQAYSGGILGPVRRMLKRKGYRPCLAREIRMPNNFQKKLQPTESDEEIIRNGLKAADEFCQSLIRSEWRWADIPVYSGLMSLFSRLSGFYVLYRKMFSLAIEKDRCISCKRCVKLCPVGNWKMSEDSALPVNHNTCMLCQRCVSYCPRNAITIAGKTPLQYAAVSAQVFPSHPV